MDFSRDHSVRSCTGVVIRTLGLTRAPYKSQPSNMVLMSPKTSAQYFFFFELI